MARYRMQDDVIVDTESAQHVWKEIGDFDGRNYISRATGSQFEHERLYRSKKGRYYVESWSDWQGSQASARWITDQEATSWLMLMEHTVPDALTQHVESVSE